MSLFRRGDRKPSTVALIFTPLQALNLLEYAETTGNEPLLILVGNSPQARNREQIGNVLAGATAKVTYIAGHSGVPRPGARQDAALAEIDFHLSTIEGPLLIVFGEYRSSLVWRVIRRHDLPGDRVVFVDDGAATLLVDRINTANDAVPWEASETVAPVYGPGIHLVTQASHTYTAPSEKAPKVRVLTEGDQVEVVAVARKGERLWGIDPAGEFIRMGHVLWHAPLPQESALGSSIDFHGGAEWVSDANFAPTDAVTFFTSYHDKELRAGPDDTVIANEFPRLKRLYRDLDVDPGRVIVIGTPLQLIGVSAAKAKAYNLEMVALARSARPDAEIVYVPHRSENDADIAHLAGECTIERHNLPFELVPLDQGRLPGLCATFYSSLALNLLDLAGERLSVISLRVDPEDYEESRRETVQRVYERIATHPSGATQVVESTRRT